MPFKFIFVIFSTLIFISPKLYALSCVQGWEAKCYDISNVDSRHLCMINARAESDSKIFDNKLKANNCMLSHKMKRREFLQAQCKTKTVKLSSGCQTSQYCLPNGLEGQFVNAYSGEIIASSDVDLNSPGFIWGDSPYYKCTDGQWQHLVTSANKGI